MDLKAGDVVEVMYRLNRLNTVRVFGEIKQINEKRMRLLIWDGSRQVIDYDEMNLELCKIESFLFNPVSVDQELSHLH